MRIKAVYTFFAYLLFFVLFAVIYSENAQNFAVSSRAFVTAVIALVGVVFNGIVCLRIARKPNCSIVDANAVVAAWTEHKLDYRQQLLSAVVNLASMAVFVLLVWLFKSYLAGMVLVVAVIGYEISELLRSRYKRINFWVFSFSTPVFIFILVFVVLFILSGLK